MPIEFDTSGNDFVIRHYKLENQEIETSLRNYKPGEYRFSATSKGDIILKNITNKMNVFLEKDKNTVIKVVAHGYADGMPMKNTTYNGMFKDTIHIEYRNHNEQTKILTRKFIKGNTLLTNDDIALFRAYDIVDYLKRRFRIEEKNITIYIETFKETGPQYRGCDFHITLEKAYRHYHEDCKRLRELQ